MSLNWKKVSFSKGGSIAGSAACWIPQHAWWRYQMGTFSALLAICAGNSPVPGEFPGQRPVTRSFDVFFDLRPNKWHSKQSWGCWLETPSIPLWRHCNGVGALEQHSNFPILDVAQCDIHVGVITLGTLSRNRMYRIWVLLDSYIWH